MSTATVARPDRPRFLIADDDAVVRSSLAIQLQGHFDCVGAAADAQQAIALVAAEKPDVVILDVDMPAGGALHATREIAICSPDTTILILSADEEAGHVASLMQAGATAYLRKGIDAASLTAQLSSAMEAHRYLLATSEM